MLEYKGYKGIIDYYCGDEYIYGLVVGLPEGTASFQAKTLKGLTKEFRKLVNKLIAEGAVENPKLCCRKILKDLIYMYEEVLYGLS